MVRPHLWKRLRGSLLVGLGFMLSPLSWWNDVVFNLPIALAVGYAASWIVPDGLIWGTMAGYWLSNVLGVVLMQWGASAMLNPTVPPSSRSQLWLSLGLSTLYTLVVAGLVYSHVLSIPEFVLAALPGSGGKSTS
ncbi:MAG: hypothetical protein OHK0012_00800 [Synechococcales cyanobacterium]